MGTKIRVYLGILLLFSFLVSSNQNASNQNLALEQQYTLTFVEGDLVKVQPVISDPDNDAFLIYYALPLNESGEWQTGFNDAGVYYTKITVSDGVYQTESNLTIIVKNKNQPPEIKTKKIVVKEGETVDLSKVVSDPDKDNLSAFYSFPFDANGIWATGYLDAGSYSISLTVSDGEYNLTKKVPVVVKNKNYPPQINSSYFNLSLSENTTFGFKAEVVDLDNQALTYNWLWDDQQISSQPSFDYYFDFNAAGKHNLTLIVSDSETETAQSWLVWIDNLNQAPAINLPEFLYYKETDKIRLNLPKLDSDKEKVNYTFYPPFNRSGEWQTTYEDYGNYTTLIIASDSQSTTWKKINLVIADVDRAPTYNLSNGTISIKEEELYSLNLDSFVSDPDGDKVFFTLANLPSGASFSNNLLSWQPGYDFVQRQVNFFTNLLSRLKIEKRLIPQYKLQEIQVFACGKELCANHTLSLKVNNINRAPVLSNLENITVKENQTVVVKPKAVDPDNDFLQFYFDQPLDSNGRWQTSYNNSGFYCFNVTVSDGYLNDTKPVEVVVKDENQAPFFYFEQTSFEVKENEQIAFQLNVTDFDSTNLTFSAQGLPSNATFNQTFFSWKPSYETATKNQANATQKLLVNFTVSDGELITTQPILFIVENVDRSLSLTEYSPERKLTVFVNQSVLFYINASDPDDDNLTYLWSFGLWDSAINGTSLLNRTFTSPGDKTVSVEVSDGAHTLSWTWFVSVVKPAVEEKGKSQPEKAELFLSLLKKEKNESVTKQTAAKSTSTVVSSTVSPAVPAVSSSDRAPSFSSSSAVSELPAPPVVYVIEIVNVKPSSIGKEEIVVEPESSGSTLYEIK